MSLQGILETVEYPCDTSENPAHASSKSFPTLENLIPISFLTGINLVLPNRCFSFYAERRCLCRKAMSLLFDSKLYTRGRMDYFKKGTIKKVLFRFIIKISSPGNFALYSLKLPQNNLLPSSPCNPIEKLYEKICTSVSLAVALYTPSFAFSPVIQTGKLLVHPLEYVLYQPISINSTSGNSDAQKSRKQ